MTTAPMQPAQCARGIIREPEPAGIRAWLVPILTLAVAAGLGGCAMRPQVDVSLIGLAPVEATLLEQRLRLDFRLQNFGERAIRITGFTVALDVNGRELARGVDAGAFTVDGLSDARASAVVSTSLFQVARQLLELRERDVYDYELTGRLHLGGWPRSVSFARSGEISREELERLVGAGNLRPQPLTL